MRVYNMCLSVRFKNIFRFHLPEIIPANLCAQDRIGLVYNIISLA